MDWIGSGIGMGIDGGGGGEGGGEVVVLLLGRLQLFVAIIRMYRVQCM